MRILQIMDLNGVELGPKMLACNERERKFIWAYALNGGNGAEAAREAGYSDIKDGAKVRAHQLLHRDRVIEALDEVGRKMFRSLLIPAITARRVLIERPEHPDHEKAVDKTLAALGHGPRTGVDVSVTGEIAVNHTDAAVEDLRRLRSLGVPRETLLEVFGFSGLERYEKILKVADAKLIEGRVERD